MTNIQEVAFNIIQPKKFPIYPIGVVSKTPDWVYVATFIETCLRKYSEDSRMFVTDTIDLQTYLETEPAVPLERKNGYIVTVPFALIVGDITDMNGLEMFIDFNESYGIKYQIVYMHADEDGPLHELAKRTCDVCIDLKDDDLNLIDVIHDISNPWKGVKVDKSYKPPKWSPFIS